MKKNRKLSIVLLFLLFTTLVFGIMGCSSNSSNDKNKKTLVVGTNAEFAPFEYVDENGNYDGFDIALMKELGNRMGYNIKFSNMEFKSLTASVKTGGIDAAIAGMTITDERKQSVDFTDSYFSATQCIIVNKKSKVKKIEDLNGKKIGVQEGTTGDLLVTPDKNNKRITDSSTIVKRFKKGTDAIVELKNKGVEAVVIDASPAKKFVSMNSNTLKLVKDTESEENYGIAVTKGNTKLVKEFNSALKEVKKDGTYDKLLDKYINKVSTKNDNDSSNVFTKFISRIKNVFITTNGYKLIIKGLWTTIYIAASAVAIGIVLGFIIALMRITEARAGHKTILSRIANIYITALRGTPVIVQLLIMYMVIFKSHLGIIAAILTFGLNSGAYVAEIIRSGIMAVDNGQMEGGLSLGFTYGQTMRFVIIPQAIKNCLPALGNEFISLIKETSIVGYVAIQDLTKAADFIISRTYETFIPLITIAIIYLIIVLLLTKLLSLMERRLRQSDNR